MAARTLPGIGLTGGRSAGEDGWGDEMNANLLRSSVLTQLSAKSRVAALPGSPTNGDIYILTTDNRVAVRDADAWVYFVPSEGWQAWVQDVDLLYGFNGTAWATLNAATATKLATARSIAGSSFDGSANISISDTALSGVAWSTYTPTATAASGTFTTVAASGSYKKIGKTVFVRLTVQITTNGTAAGSVNVTLPFTSAATSFAQWVFAGREGALTGKMLQGSVNSSSASCVIANYDNTYPGNNGALLNISGVYEAT